MRRASESKTGNSRHNKTLQRTRKDRAAELRRWAHMSIHPSKIGSLFLLYWILGLPSFFTIGLLAKVNGSPTIVQIVVFAGIIIVGHVLAFQYIRRKDCSLREWIEKPQIIWIRRRLILTASGIIIILFGIFLALFGERDAGFTLFHKAVIVSVIIAFGASMSFIFFFGYYDAQQDAAADADKPRR